METVLFCIVFLIVGLLWGWNLRKSYVQMLAEKLTANILEHQEESEDVIHINIEKHNGMLYVYDKKTNTFMAQAESKEKLEDALQKRYPNKRFACSEATLLEVGFIS